MTATFTLGQLAERLGATLRGAEGKVITGLATLQEARPEQLSFWPMPSTASTWRRLRPVPCC